MAEEMTFRERMLSVGVVGLSSSPRTKTRVDDHGTHTVEVTEHRSDRVDVTVKPPTTHKGARR